MPTLNSGRWIIIVVLIVEIFSSLFRSCWELVFHVPGVNAGVLIFCYLGSICVGVLAWKSDEDEFLTLLVAFKYGQRINGKNWSLKRSGFGTKNYEIFSLVFCSAWTSGLSPNDFSFGYFYLLNLSVQWTVRNNFRPKSEYYFFLS